MALKTPGIKAEDGLFASLTMFASSAAVQEHLDENNLMVM